MIEKVLANCLRPIIQAEARLRNRRVLSWSLCLGAAGLLCLLYLALFQQWWSWIALFFVLLVSLLCLILGAVWARSRRTCLHDLAQRVEEKHPDLRMALLTAFSQKPAADGSISYLQSRVLAQVTEHATRKQWVRQVSSQNLRKSGWVFGGALFAYCASFLLLMLSRPEVPTVSPAELSLQPVAGPQTELEVSPGDVEIEKGARLVVEAHFSGKAPATATLVLLEPEGNEQTEERGRIPMQTGLDDGVFSALIDQVDSPGRYYVKFDEKESDQYQIDTFEYPKLKRADAKVTPPDYVEEEPREIENTRKISLLEGSQVEWRIQINKPVVAAELFGEDESILPLSPSREDPTILVGNHIPDKTKKYRLHLIDDRDLSNKRPPWITVTVKKNLPPKLEFVFPKRDVELSALQEFSMDGRVWDDVAILQAGVTFHYGENEETVTLIDSKKEGGTYHPIATQFDVEKLGAKPRDLILYHLWAEDIGPDGNTRRTESDQFLAEVRHFENIFREVSAPGGQPGEEGQGQAEKLLKLQKEILNAGWKILRRQKMGRSINELAEDIKVIQESQVIAVFQTEDAINKTEETELKQIFLGAKEEMEKAAQHYEDTVAKDEAGTLQIAYNDSRRAYEMLIRAREKERRITQSNSPSQGSSNSPDQDIQMMNLELKQKDLKYQEESKAQQEQNTLEQKENLEVLNKLKELARRQEAIAEKIKELDKALQEAKTEEEKSEIERQLDRLREEQEELLRDTESLLQRMDTEENRANMAEAREGLEDIRDDIQDAAEKMEEKQLAEATNSATRAQRDLEDTKEEFRKKTSRQFSEEMKSIRQQARHLAEKQNAIGEKLEDGPQTDSESNDPFSQPGQRENLELYRELSEQGEDLANLLEEIKLLSEESEVSEPLLSDALYDAVRNSIVNGVEESLDQAGIYTRYNRPDRARTPAQAAARGIDELKEGVEQAAEKILGSEVESLRLARDELEQLIDEAKSEQNRLAQAEGTPQGQEEGEATELAMNGQKKGSQPQSGNDSQKREEGETQQGTVPDPTGLGQGQEGSPQDPETPGNGKEKSNGKVQEKGSKGKGGQKGKGERPEQAGQSSPQGREASSEGSESAAPGSSQGKGKSPDSQANSKGRQKGKGKSGSGSGTSSASSPPGPNGMRPRPSLQDSQQRLSQGNQSESSRGGGGHLFFNQAVERREQGPITGEDYKDWANRLGNIEEMVDADDIRNGLGQVMDDARTLRTDFSRDNLPPQVDTMQRKIIDPLVELRSRISEELAKLNKENPLAPIDRDPVPGEFRDLVRRYYENLGQGE